MSFFVPGVSCPVAEAAESKAERNFPFLNLRAQFETIRAEVLEAVLEVMESQHFILGPQVEQFEREVVEFLGVPHVVGCASGSDALLLALMCQDIGPGDEVITTAFTFVATAGAIARTGATPVFVDIDPRTFNIAHEQIEPHINSRTRCVIPVHLFGLPAVMDPILDVCKAKGIRVIEDAAQAMGARYKGLSVGTLGDFGCFSFFPSKNLGGCGDGGLVTAREMEVAEKLRLLHLHGSDARYHYKIVGVNSRLDALQAAILHVKLAHLEEWTAARRRRASVYRSLVREYELEEFIQLPSSPIGCDHVYNQYVIRCRDRDALRGFLSRSGLPTEIYYPTPLHLQPAFEYLGYGPGSLPETEQACAEVLALPIYPELRDEQQEEMVSVISRFFTRGNKGRN